MIRAAIPVKSVQTQTGFGTGAEDRDVPDKNEHLETEQKDRRIQLAEIREMVEGRTAAKLYPSRKKYAVLIPLLELDGELQVLFEVRQAGIRQGGEICFPGGGIEPDESAEQAARRETIEELLIKPAQVEVLAPMHEMMGPGGVRVFSFLGVLHDYDGSYSGVEVDHIFTVPLSWFARHPAILSQNNRLTLEMGEDFPVELVPGGRDYPFRKIPKQHYFYRTEGGVIWGMTAELLYHALCELGIKPETVTWEP